MKKIYFLLLLTMLIGFSTIPLSAQQTLTVHNGTATNAYVPVYGYYADAYLKAEFVIPASELTDIASSNDPIISMTFYASEANVSWGSANFQVFLSEITETSLSSFVGIDNATIVYQGSLSIVDGEMEVEFTTPYTYNGGNLLIGVYNTVEGSYVTSNWYGENVNGASVQGYSYSDLGSISASQRNFIPKTTFTYGLITCAKPTAFNATIVSTTEVLLSWNGNGTSSSYNIEYGPTGFTLGTGFTEIAYDNSINISNLTEGTTYDYYVQADCGADGTSIWVGPITLNNSQYNMSATGNDTITSCGMVIYDNGGPNGDYSNSCNSTLVIYPATENTVVSISGTNSSEPSYNGCYDYLRIYDGVGTNGTQLVNSCGYGQTVNAISSTGPLTIHFHSDGSTAAAGFELLVSCVSCFAPGNITATDITTSEATLSWTGPNEFGSYIVTYSDGTNTETEEVYGQTLYLTNLAPATTYTVQIQSLCDDGDTSMLSTAYSFNTSCAAIDITDSEPWTENFEGYSGGGEQPFVCWDTPVTTSGGGPFVYCNYYPSCHSGSNSAELKGANNMLILPEFSNDIHTLRLSFWATAVTPSNGTLEIGVVSDMNDPVNNFELVSLAGTPGNRGPNNATTDGWGNYMGPFDFNGVQATSGRIAFRYTSSGTNNSWNLDDFTVSLIPACNAPVATSVTATNVLGHSATISWTDNDENHSVWTVYYKAANEENWSSTPASATTIELTGLAPETAYQVYVVTVCDGVEGTDATITIGFTTDVACPAPSGITASNVSTDGASINWLGEADTYTIEYGIAGFTPGSGTIVSNISGNSYDLNNLTANTAYTIYIYGDCGAEDGISQTANYTFRTSCTSVSVTGTPWTENFENSVDDPECWVSAQTATRNNHTFPHIEPTASIAHGGSKALEIAFGDIVTALPQFDENLSDLMLTFWAYNNRYSSNYNTVLELGYITNPYDTSTFVPTDTYTYTTYTQVIKSFSNLADLNLPSTTRIAFRYRQQSSSNLTSWYIDDMTVELIPDCMHPTNLHATNVDETEVTLAWTEMGTATGWNIEYGTTEFTPGQSIGTEVFADANPYTIDNLIGGTAYHFYVQADCGSTWEGPFTVIPGQYVMNATGSDTLTTCGMVIYDNGGANGQYSNSCNSTLVLYPANPDAKLSLTGTATTESGWDYLYVYDGVGTDGDYIARYHGNNQVVNVLSTTGPLTVKFTSDASGQRDGFELIVQCVTCYPPTNFTASDVSLDEATISWSGNADGYGVYVILSDTTYYTTTDTFLTLSNLMPSSSYRVYVRSLCGGDSSALSQAFNFSTSCGQITIDETTPWFEDFEGYPGAANTAVSVGACWATPETQVVDNGTSPFVYLGYANSAYSGLNTLEMKGGPTMVVLPEFSNDINTLRISMWGNTTASNASGAGTMALGYISDIYDPTSFVAIDTIPATAFNRTGTDAPHADFIGPYDFSGVTPQTGLRIALRLTGVTTTATSSTSWNLDDITVSLIPGCPSPVKTSVTASNVDGHNATISWVDHDATHDSWTVFYKANNETSWQSVIAGPTPSTDLNNLDPETAYEVYVITNCATPDQVADETNHINFTTTIACPAPTGIAVSNVGMTSATVTWNGTAGSYIIEYGESGFTPGSGTTETVYSNTTVLTSLTAGTAYTVYVTADCGGIDGTSSAATTNFNTNLCDVADQCSYTFNLADNFGDGWNGASITVQQNGITVATLGITSGYSATETVPLCDNESTSLIWHSGNYDSECSFTVTGPDGTEIYATSGTPSGTLTTFTTNCNGSTPPPTCNVPTNLNATATAYNTANVTWTAGGTETSWNLQYRTGSANWTTLPVNATTYQITGLAAQTTYEVRVQANCGNNNTSDWTAAVSFTTPAAPANPCNAPTNLQVNSITQTSATITWTAGGNENAWNVQYKLQSSQQWQEANVQQTTYTIEGLTANSTYDVRVKAVCAADNQSDFVSTTFTTTGVGIDNISMANSISLMPNPADNYIELNVNSNVEVKEAVVFNAFGQMIQTVQLTENHARIDLSNMATGMYFVRVNGEGVTATKKFIKR